MRKNVWRTIRAHGMHRADAIRPDINRFFADHSTGRGFLCRSGSESFSLGMAGWTVVGGFGLRGAHLAESPLYLGLWDEHRCAFALIETINNRD